MEKIKKWYRKLNLQNKLRISYIALILIPVTVICVVYYEVASQSIIEIAKNNILEGMIKNVQILDRDLKGIQESAQGMNLNNEIYKLLEDLPKSSDFEILQKDKKARLELQKAFSNEYILTANIFTPEFVFGDNGNAIIPVQNFYESEIYREAIKSAGKMKWIPTYHAEKEYGVDYRMQKVNYFSLIEELQPVYIEPENISSMKSMKQNMHAVLVLNFNPEFMDSVLEEKKSIEGSFFCVSDREGTIVAHTDQKKNGSKEQLPWLTKITKNNGSMILEYQGEKVLICYAVSEITDWVVVNVIPLNSLLNHVSIIQRLTILIWMVLFLLAMFFSRIFSRRITKPVERLVRAMQMIGEGNFEQRLPVNGEDEIQYLTEKYNEMRDKIECLIEENYKSEIRNKESEIMALTLQLNPHFLYNTLNIINMLALENGDIDASNLIISLSDMLQYTFRNKKELVVFREEYQWLQNYLTIMQIRYEGKFEVRYNIDETVSDCMIPKLILQPLVENAIMHGFRGLKRKGVLVIYAKKEDEKICIGVKDNGAGMTPETIREAMEQTSNRIGLGNVILRIQLLYGENGRVDIQSKAGEETEIRIYFPMKS